MKLAITLGTMRITAVYGDSAVFQLSSVDMTRSTWTNLSLSTEVLGGREDLLEWNKAKP